MAITDYGPNGLNGTLKNLSSLTANSVVSGIQGTFFSDGSGGNGAAVGDGSGGLPAPIPTLDTNEDLTIEAWVKVQTISNRTNTIAAVNGSWMINVEGDGALYLRTYGFALNTPANSISLNTWYHVAAVVEGGVDAKLYIDGIEKAQSSRTDTSNDRSDVFSIGVRGTNINPIHGEIAELRLWNNLRSQSDIQNNKDSRLIGNETGLIGYWKLDEAAPASETDSAGVVAGNVAAFIGVETATPSSASVITAGFSNPFISFLSVGVIDSAALPVAQTSVLEVSDSVNYSSAFNAWVRASSGSIATQPIAAFSVNKKDAGSITAVYSSVSAGQTKVATVQPAEFTEAAAQAFQIGAFTAAQETAQITQALETSATSQETTKTKENTELTNVIADLFTVSAIRKDVDVSGIVGAFATPRIARQTVLTKAVSQSLVAGNLGLAVEAAGLTQSSFTTLPGLDKVKTVESSGLVAAFAGMLVSPALRVETDAGGFAVSQAAVTSPAETRGGVEQEAVFPATTSVLQSPVASALNVQSEKTSVTVSSVEVSEIAGVTGTPAKGLNPTPVTSVVLVAGVAQRAVPKLDSPAFRQTHNLVAFSLSALPELKATSSNKTYNLTSTEVVLTPEFKLPSVSQFFELLADNYKTAVTVEKTKLYEAHYLIASKIQAAVFAEQNNFSQTHKLVTYNLAAQPANKTAFLYEANSLSTVNVKAKPVFAQAALQQYYGLLAFRVNTQLYFTKANFEQHHNFKANAVTAVFSQKKAVFSARSNLKAQNLTNTSNLKQIKIQQVHRFSKQSLLSNSFSLNSPVVIFFNKVIPVNTTTAYTKTQPLTKVIYTKTQPLTKVIYTKDKFLSLLQVNTG